MPARVCRFGPAATRLSTTALRPCGAAAAGPRPSLRAAPPPPAALTPPLFFTPRQTPPLRNPTNLPHKLAFMKYDPVVRQHVLFQESKMPKGRGGRRAGKK